MRLLRIFFEKTGTAAYISHLDLQRVMARGLRKSGLPVWWSQGFNPHIYMTFALPLPLLHESVCECVDVKTEGEEDDFARFVQPLDASLPQGITVTAMAPPRYGADAISAALYEICYAGCAAKVGEMVSAYNAADTAMTLRKTKRTQERVDMKAVLPHIEPPDDGVLRAVLPAGARQHYSPALLCRYLEETGGPAAEKAQIIRKQVFTADGSVFC